MIGEDDFSTTRWPVSADEKVTYQYLDGEYRISVNAPLVMKAFSPFPKQSNVIIEVKAKVVASGGNSGYGIAFRENDGNYYYLRISDNRYGIDKRFQQKWETLHSLTKSDYIKTDGSSNVLKVACLGDTIEVSVNGQWLATIKDSSFNEGRIALVAEGAEGKDTVVTFDNFKIYAFNDAYLQKNAPQFLVANKTPVPTPSPTAVPTPTSTPGPTPSLTTAPTPTGTPGPAATTVRQYTNTEWGYVAQDYRDWSIDDSDKAIVKLVTQGISIFIAGDTTQAGVELSKYATRLFLFPVRPLPISRSCRATG